MATTQKSKPTAGDSRIADNKKALFNYAIEERFGHYAQPVTEGGYVWVHAVSLGETRAAAVLLQALRAAQPGIRILLTHGTATGRAQGVSLLQEGDVQVLSAVHTGDG